MDAVERSQSQPQNRRASISSFVANRKDRKTKDDISTSSGTTSEAGYDPLALSHETSSDSRLDKFRGKLLGSEERRDSGDSYRRRLSARLPGRRKKRGDDDDIAGGADLDGGSPGVASLVGGSEEDSLSRADSIASSQLTEDPEPDSRSLQQ
jgi:hypothetical protein